MTTPKSRRKKIKKKKKKSLYKGEVPPHIETLELTHVSLTERGLRPGFRVPRETR